MIEPDCLELYEDAAFYDVEFAERAHELPFFRRWATKCGSPVLEIACGTGRLTLPIAAAGIEIVGTDISRPMLDRARAKTDPGMSVEWIEQDCRALNLHRQFKLAFIATNAMQHLQDTASINGFLRAARDHIASDGQLIIDVFKPALAKLRRSYDLRYEHKRFVDTDGVEVVVEAQSRYSEIDQILHFDLHYLKESRLIRRKAVNMRCFFPAELRYFIEHAGLEIVHAFGDYDESNLCDSSPKQILVCRRRP